MADPDDLAPAGSFAVCLATSAAMPGGVWRHMVELADGLKDRGIDVRVEVPAGLREEAEARGLVGPSRRREILHVHLADTYNRRMTWQLLAARARGCRAVITEHLPRSDASDARIASRPPRPLAPLVKTGIKRLQFAMATRVIVVSGGSKDFVTERYRPRPGLVEVVPNGVGPAEARDHTSAHPYRRIIATGAVIAQKGFDLLVGAARLAQRDWVVDVFGSGPHLERLQAQAQDMRISTGESRLNFRGWSDEVDLQLGQAHALVVPSRWEALPYSALEAMALGKPVIATSVDGLSDLVVDGVTGFLVQPTAASIGSALDAFSSLPASEVEDMGARGRERVREQFTLDGMVSRTIAVYQSAVPAGRVR